MSYILSNLLQDGISLLGNSAYWRSTASGGSTTTLVDDSTKMDDMSREDLESGTVIVVRDGGGANAAPENEIGVVSSYDSSSKTMTIPALTAAIASGDEYMLIGPQYPLIELRRIANLALQKLGVFPHWDTSLTTAQNQTEYDLPIADQFDRHRLEVYVQSIDGVSGDNGWKIVPKYMIIPASPGVAETLVIPQQAAGLTLGIRYYSVHPKVYSYDDVIDEAVHPTLAQLLFAVEIMSWLGITDDNRDLANKLLSDLADAKKEYTIKRKMTNNFLVWS